MLGPIEMLTSSGKRVAVGGDRQEALLATLLARRGQVVSADQLIDLLWSDNPPRRPENALQVLVSRLRSAAREAGSEFTDLQTRPPGYVLTAGDNKVNAAVFEQLVADANDAEPSTAIELLRRALALWTGTAFGEHADSDVARLEAMRLNEMRRSAGVGLGGALVAASRPDEAIGVLEPLARENPFDERTRAELMRALYSQGRHADALAVYQDHRSLLAEELGLEPSASLRQLEVDILRHEMPADSSTNRQPLPALGNLIVRQLPTPDGPVAWTRIGSGHRLVVVPAWVTSLDVMASGRDPRSSILDRLVSHAELVLYDRRGTGLTGGTVKDFSVAAGSVELETVLDATGGPAVLLAMSQAGTAAIATAARRPDLVSGLILFGTYASGPATFTNTKLATAMLEVVRSHWGVGSQLLAGLYRPNVSDAAAAHLGRVLQDSAPRDVAASYLETVYTSDVSDLLPEVRCPSLIIHYRNDRVIPFAGAEQLAVSINDAQLLALDGPYHLPDAVDLDRIISAITAFLAASQ